MLPDFKSSSAGAAVMGGTSGWSHLVRALRNRLKPRCPDCGQRALGCCYIVPGSYSEPAPRYFRCAGCGAHYLRLFAGPYLPIRASECPSSAAAAASGL